MTDFIKPEFLEMAVKARTQKNQRPKDPCPASIKITRKRAFEQMKEGHDVYLKIDQTPTGKIKYTAFKQCSQYIRPNLEYCRKHQECKDGGKDLIIWEKFQKQTDTEPLNTDHPYVAKLIDTTKFLISANAIEALRAYIAEKKGGENSLCDTDGNIYKYDPDTMQVSTLDDENALGQLIQVQCDRAKIIKDGKTYIVGEEYSLSGNDYYWCKISGLLFDDTTMDYAGRKDLETGKVSLLKPPVDEEVDDDDDEEEVVDDDDAGSDSED